MSNEERKLNRIIDEKNQEIARLRRENRELMERLTDTVKEKDKYKLYLYLALDKVGSKIIVPAEVIEHFQTNRITIRTEYIGDSNMFIVMGVR